MRRAANLFVRIPALDNLRIAFHKAARGRRHQAVVRQFSVCLDRRLEAMALQIARGTFQVGRFHQFLIRDPKERVITAPCFEERVLHHAIMNVCEPVMNRWLVADSFACRANMGREVAVQRALRFSRNANCFLKLDIRKYFDSIRHDRLLALLSRRFRDRQLLELFARIVHGYRGNLGVGLPIGSLTSQHFANLYLGPLDRFVKETLRIGGYVRYMDDMVLWHLDRDELMTAKRRCFDFVETELGLELKPAEPRGMRGGVSFLGCRVFATHVELNSRSKRRWRRRVRVLERAERLGLITQSDLQRRLTSLTAFARAAGTRSWRFRHRVLSSLSVNGPIGLEPGEPWRQLEQPRGELPDGEPQQERTDEPHEQPWFPAGPEFRG
jgi:RNA-directed DNA polymerase